MLPNYAIDTYRVNGVDQTFIIFPVQHLTEFGLMIEIISIWQTQRQVKRFLVYHFCPQGHV